MSHFRPCFLPCLFRTLGEIDPDNKVLEWTLYALCSACEEDEETSEAVDAGRGKRVTRFTEPQRASVRAFLGLVTSAPGFAFHHEPIAPALEAIRA